MVLFFSIKNMEDLSHQREYLQLDSLPSGLQTKNPKVNVASENSLEVWTSRTPTYEEKEKGGRQIGDSPFYLCHCECKIHFLNSYFINVKNLLISERKIW